MENQFVKNLVSRMDLDQKIGALLTLGFTGTLVRPHIYDAIVKYHCGGLRLTPVSRLFGSYVNPKSGRTVLDVTDTKGYKNDMAPPSVSASQYSQMLDELSTLARSRPLALPLHFSFDQEGGTSADFNFGGVNIFPKPMGIRATGDPNLAYAVAKAISRQAKAVGFNWIHSPVLDVNTEPMNPEIYTRAYSDVPEEVAEYAAKSCEGFKEGKMIATGKHFPGRGDSAVDAHFEMPVIKVEKDTMFKRELLPYRELIKKDMLPSIMIAHSIFPAFDDKDIATVSKKILTGLLRDTLGFDGVITTDSMTMGGVAVRYGVANACALALEAGADLVLMKAENSLVGETFSKIKEFVKSGRISETELDQKVYRVLKVKYDYGLFTEFKKENPEEVIGDTGIIALSKHIAKHSVMVHRGKDLPLGKTSKILLIEQINKTPNDFYWHPGSLYKKCLAYNKNIDYLETNYTFDEDDKARILQNIGNYDAVILTNFYIRGKISNNEFIEQLPAKEFSAEGKKLIVITNTPYPISVPKNCDNLIVSYATSPDNLEVCAGVLFGEIHAEGTYPVLWGKEQA
ncbi:beta-glucosidase [Spirochaetia bacterium]|nr:beta-glucosidase [Spirochaetia bacterium]